MHLVCSILSLILLSLLTVDGSTNDSTRGIHIQIFDNIAEISEPISPTDLPRTYTQQEWSDIRSDSFRLVGQYVNVQAQVISLNRPTLNGQKILIQRSPNSNNYTEATMIDETRNLVQDLVDKTFYTIGNDRIRYLTMPAGRNYSVNFVYKTNHPEQLHLRYLQKNLKWKVRYDLLLENNDSDSILQAYADIRNDGSSSLLIDSAELISGDVDIRSVSSSAAYQEQSPGDYAAYAALDMPSGGQQVMSVTTPAPMISAGEELAGTYVFSINETFTLAPRSNYVLPLFRPVIDVERYGVIDKAFIRMDNRGHFKRAYRLRVADKYLPEGQVFIRESDRLVGETMWSDRSANETNDFHLGEDPDLQYTESVQLNSRRQAYEANGYRFILSTYTIQLRLTNNKKRPMNVEYRLRFASQENLTLKENTANSSLQVDGTTISGIFPLDEGDDEQVKFTVETQ